MINIPLAIIVIIGFYLLGRYLKDNDKKKDKDRTKIVVATIIGLFFLIFLIWILSTYWKDIDFFRGRGGTPYGEPGCYYNDCY